MARLIVVFAFISLLAAIPCSAAIITVDPNGSADYTTIQAGINAAVSGADTVVVAEGTYVENISFGGKDIILTSEDPEEPNVVADTIIDGGGIDTVVRFNGTETSNCKISGFTITNGYGPADEDGGGITGPGRATITNCIIRDNVAQRHGGGIRGNDGFYGLINRCIIFGNSAFYNGGGLTGCHGTISNCLIYDNTAAGYGGGMVNCDGDIVNCTIVDNTAGVSGGGIAWSIGTITNCIVWGNNLEQIFDSSTPTYSCIQDWSAGGTGNIWTDPNFALPGDYHIMPGSPCIDAGNNDTVPVGIFNDLEGSSRFTDDPNTTDTGYGTPPIVDMGAYEFQVLPTIAVWPTFVEFSALQDGTNPPDQILKVRNGGRGVINWQISEACDWLTASPNSGSSTGEPNDVTLSVDISGLDWGVYNYNLIISDPCAINSPRVVSVSLDITGPIIELSMYEFSFEADVNGLNPEDQMLAICNIGGGTLNWEITETCDWLTIDPCSGNSAGEPNDVNLSVDISGLGWGIYNCQLTVSDPCAMNSPQNVMVTLIISDADGMLHVPSEYPTIQAAIDIAFNGEMVIVADGTYTGPGNRDIDFLGKAITVKSANGPENCIIDPNGSEADGHRGFYFHNGEDPDSILDGFTIKKGYIIGSGGGIACINNSSPTIRNCIICDSIALNGNGGGILCNESNPTISNCIITGCYGVYGGGIRCVSASPTIKDCTIADNTAGNDGGGLYNCDGPITNCVIIDNFGYLGGGLSGCDGPIIKCSITDNTAHSVGGGLYRCGGPIAYCIITGNRAALDGGGLYRCNGPMAYCTITGNEADGNRGGGMFDCDGMIKHCIIWGNTDGTAADQTYSSSTPTYSCIQDWTGGGIGNIDADPLFALGHWDPNDTPSDPNDDFWVYDDCHLKSEAGRWDPNTQAWVKDDVHSPCIDTGDPNYFTGELWPHGKRINMGAYGGTAEASMSLSDVGNIADLNEDDEVESQDLCLFGYDWLRDEVLLKSDLDRNGRIDLSDFSIMAFNWLWPEQ